MPDQTPIACSLGGDEVRKRQAEMAALGKSALIDARPGPAGAELRFAARAGVRERVGAIVAAESRCCPFLTMELRDEPDVVVLSIEGPTDAAIVVEEIVGAFSAAR
jgi:MerR family transcriptional regulator, copper efflux regulator